MDNKCTYHFELLRLKKSPQTRVSSLSIFPGFTSLDSILEFCDLIGFGFEIYYYDTNGKKIQVYIDEK